MKHRNRGKCVIFNNKCFDIHTRLNERRGTEVDAKALYGVFRDLEFDVNVYNDASARDIVAILETSIDIHITYIFINFFFAKIQTFVSQTLKVYALKTY
jgi:hypothetical protein